MEFETRCVKLYDDARPHEHTVSRTTTITTDDLEAMFPNLDPALVQILAADAGSPHAAMETLLTLAAGMAAPTVPSRAPDGLALEDASAFPSLVGADGWEVCSAHQLEQKPEADRGRAWCDRAKAIASKPAPKPNYAIAPVVANKNGNGPAEPVVSDVLHADVETDYEYRHRLGKQRIQNRSKFGRGAKAKDSSTYHVANSGVDDGQASEKSSEGSEDTLVGEQC